MSRAPVDYVTMFQKTGYARPGPQTRAVLLSLCLACTAALLLLAACGGWTLESATEENRWERLRIWARDEAEPRAVDLSILAPADDPDLQARLADLALATLRSDPSISPTVTVEPLTPRLYQQVRAGRVQPDVLVLNAVQIADLVDAQQLSPLALSAQLTNALEPRLLDAGMHDGQLYCAPHSFHTLALFYNKALFDEAVVDYPNNRWQWSDLRAAAAAVDELPTFRFMPFGLVLGPDISRWMPFLLQATPTPPLDDAGAIFADTAAMQSGLDFVTALYTDTLAATPGYFSAAWAGEVFGNGRAAMTIEGNWLVDFLADRYPELNYGIVPLPAGESAATLLFTTCIAVGAHTVYPDLVPRVVQALLDADVHAMAIPARTAQWPAWQTLHPDADAFINQVDRAALWRGSWASVAQIDGYQEIIRGLLEGDLSVRDAVTAFNTPDDAP